MKGKNQDETSNELESLIENLNLEFEVSQVTVTQTNTDTRRGRGRDRCPRYNIRSEKSIMKIENTRNSVL